MGLRVERKDELFKLTSTVSEERLHEKEWISKKEAKAILVDRVLHDFISKIIEIHLEFPHHYSCHGKYIIEPPEILGSRWMLDNAYGEDGWDRMLAKFKEIASELELDFDIKFKDEE